MQISWLSALRRHSRLRLGIPALGRWGWLAAFLYVACGAIRLARFNVQINTVEGNYFQGLPIPAAAGMVATVIIFWHM